MLRVRQIEVDINKNTEEQIIKKVAYKLKINQNDIKKIKINKKSLDARKKTNIKFIYEVDIEVKGEDIILSKNLRDVLKTPYEEYQIKRIGTKKMTYRPIVVGSGPAGLFCAYLLAQNGYAPLIIERGERIEKRIETVEKFWQTGELNCNSNVQFGEGGAGTFSDGKLNTLTKDPMHRMKKIFEIFVDCGSSSDIMYSNKPHIGTDVLREVVKNIRNKIINMGGEFKFNTCLTNLIIENNQIKAIEVNNSETIKTDNLVLAIGHSARDTFTMLFDNNIVMSPKSFAVGVRIEHLQSMINQSQYGMVSHPELDPASYKLTYTAKNGRGVYSFCMCPGGYVVNASSDNKMIAINGMSNYARESDHANSAIVVSVTPNDFGTHPLAGMEFQRKLETVAYQIGNGNIPVQIYKDFKNNHKSTNIGLIKPNFKGRYQLANLNNIFPAYIKESLIEGIEYFGTKIQNFNMDDALLSGVESRTSSPIRIERNEELMSNINGIYPCGEGSGYAGGITTSAMDGIKVAEKIIELYKGFG